MNRLRLTSFILLACSVLVVGCSDPKGSLPIRYDIPQRPNTLDPQFCQTTEARLLTANLYENLTALTQEGEVAAAAAESWKISPDGLTYTFTLRGNLRWSNGALLTSQDFLFAFRRVFDPQHPSPAAESFSMIENAEEVLSGIFPASALGIVAPDAHTVVFKLKHPYPAFLQTLSLCAAAPCNEAFFVDQKGRYGLAPEHLIANGPFALASQSDTLITLQKNTHYRNPPLSETIHISVGRGDAVSLFLQGRSDLCMLPYQRQTSQGYNGDTYYNASWLLMFSPTGFFGDRCDLRAAFIGALDTALTQRLPPHIPPAAGLIPPDSKIFGFTYRDLAGPLSPVPLLANPRSFYLEALNNDLPKGLPKLNLLIADDPLDTELGGVAQSIWQQKLSAYVNLEPLPLASLTARVTAGRFDIAIAPLPAEGLYPQDMLAFFAGSPWTTCFDQSTALPEGQGNRFLTSQDMDRQLKSIRFLSDAGDAAGICLAVEQAIADNHMAFPLYDAPSLFARREGVSGGEYHPATQVVLFASAVRLSP